ncbi:MAG: 16S rRNA (cytidine(1402)-2'-O)-methyltransferase [Lachnospiraceae bacterium]|uniref:Ribosomal RNA small subunit methyltransferase I n=1 Tax=Candidatus Weimeria bifida TaxID=2599074 RepID=A0A6N7J043_9FIRM|nr:16S rRNA (cytidine(1402)-2'-O)-methyltransferase [Candidatus Weimeria bifida]RRF95289.1 MAG: 16S rRNA (cytidine(1402)-2'-O)-methyltransferase [Lachnospiraceae bacterium]
MDSEGALYLVATPIGNLEDITFRAVRILKEADLIAAEDTRTSGVLLNHFEIHTPVTSYHEFNKIEKADYLISEMQSGKNVACITDAGTPGISDPGEELVKKCYEAGIPVYSVPGPAACIAAVTSSGLSCRRFAFEAFLPKDKKEHERVISELKKETRTIIIYEAPHHLKKTLAELREELGADRRLTICRELTKKFEDKVQTNLGDAVEFYDKNDPRGEYVLVIEGRSKEEVEKDKQQAFSEISLEDHMKIFTGQGMSEKEAMKAVAKERGVSKRDIYKELKISK